MAKESMKAKERKREKLAAQYAEKRALLRKAQSEGDWEAMYNLQKLPKNSMGVRKHNRCQLTGRPRGYMRQFGISRVTFREMALAGKIPGITKASW
jgi:small subunit ribosomal protein S14